MGIQLPDEIWDETEYTSIHAAVLFADLENSVAISSTLPPKDYDNLVNDFQSAMQELVETLRADGYLIGESCIQGDQLSIFFYSEDEVQRNYQLDGPKPAQGEERTALIKACRTHNENMLFNSLKAALFLKNLWLVQPFNMRRSLNRREPYGLGIGLHWGKVFLRNRSDGNRRIEGYTVNLAKRIESASRMGKFSHIMVSEPTCQGILGSVRAHTQLRQRIFFEKYEVPLDILKGITKPQAVYELKFFHRIGINSSPEAIQQYETIFSLDHSNVWAYYQLANYYAFQIGDWEKFFETANLAYIAHPRDEKILLDLAFYFLEKKDLAQAKEFYEQALYFNPDFDLAYEQLSLIAFQTGNYDESVAFNRKAVRLSPGSAVNHLNLGSSLAKAGNREEALNYINLAIKMYPPYKESEVVIGFLKDLDAGK